MSYKSLQEVREEADRYLTGGISSRFRANYFTGIPMYIKNADGSRFTDITGKEYIDFFMAHGAVLLGHNRPEISKAISDVLTKGFYAGYDSALTIEFSRKITEAVPAAERIRFVNSGTEGTLLTLRLVRGYTKKEKLYVLTAIFTAATILYSQTTLLRKLIKVILGGEHQKW